MPFSGLAILLSGLLVFPVINAQEFQVRYFGADQGLPTSYIYDLVTDENGYLWVGTDNGAFRFDGQQFEVFDTSEGLSGQFVSIFHKDQQGRLWAGERNGGISRLEGEKFLCIVDGDSVSSQITGIASGPLSTTWYATANGLVRKIEPNGKVRSYHPELNAGSITQFAGYAYSSFLIGTESGLFVFQPEVKEGFVYQMPNVPNSKVQKISGRRNGNGYWIMMEDFSVYYMEKNGFLHEVVNASSGIAPAEFQARDLAEWDDSTLLVSSHGHGAWFLRFGRNFSFKSFQQIKGWDQNIPSFINTIRTAGDGSLWLGSYGQGLFQIPRPYFSCHKLTASGKRNPGQVNALMRFGSKEFWIATENGLHVSTETEFRTGMNSGQPISGLDGMNVTGLAFCNGKIYCGTQDNGLFLLDPVDQKPKPVTSIPSSHHVQSIATDMRGNLWVGTHDGLWFQRKGSDVFEILTVREGLSHNSVQKLAPALDGNIFVILQGGVAGKMENGKFQKLKIEDHVANSIFEDEHGIIWLGTEGRGIIRYDGLDAVNLTIHQGVPSNFCTVLFVEGRGIIWAARDREVYRMQYDPKGSDRPIRYSELSRSHDVIGEAFLAGNDGEFWLGTAGGFLRYSPMLDFENTAPPSVRIVNLEISGKQSESYDSILLQPGTYSLRIRFRGIELQNPADVRYKYILEGNDEYWSTETHSGEVVYPNLSDGKYTFKVMASNGDGRWSIAPGTIAIEIRTPFWKQYWFIGLCITFLLFLILFTIRFRTIRLQRDKQRLEQIVESRTAKIQKQQDEILRINVALEKALQGSNARNQALLEAIPDLLFAVKANGDITEIMGTAQKPDTHAETNKEIPNIYHLIGYDNRASVEAAIGYVAATRESHQINFQMDLKGSVHFYEARLAPLLDEEVLFLARDITWRILYEKEKIARQKESSRIMIQTQESERERFAKDLHDGIGQLLSATKLNVMSLEGKITADLPGLLPQVQNIKKLINDSIQEARGVSHDLMPPMLKDFGLRMALEDLAQKINVAGKIQYTFKYYGPDDNISDEVKRCVFRVVQEITNNIMKHAEASRITVQVVNSGEELIISVEDDGIGFNLREVLKRRKGLGLYSIRNRIRTFDGFLEIDSRPGRGTLFSFEIPLAEKTLQNQPN